jgi:thiol-disulfide isomerase/thioredoxin
MRRAVPWLLAAAIAVAVVIGLTQALRAHPATSAAQPFDLARAKARLAATPPPLGRLYAQANRLLPGGRPAFDRRLSALRGHPVVVNKWASWCVPCRSEFPILQSVAAQRGARVAFLGVNGTDRRSAAASLLAREPLPYPSYEDPREAIARSIEAPANYPITVFLDRRGRPAFIHQGAYATRAALERDIDRYLGA